MAPKKEKKKKEKKEEAPAEPEPEPEPAPEPEPPPPPPKQGDEEAADWFTGEEETPAEAPVEGEAVPPAEGEVPAEGEGGFGEEQPPFEPPEPIYHKPIVIGLHWRKPYMKMYSYNYDVDEFYYKPMVDYLNEKDRGFSPGHQTYAERCVKYWPGKQRQDVMLEEIRKELNLKIAKKKTDEMATKNKEEIPKWRDPLERHSTYGIPLTNVDPVHLKAAKKTTAITDDVMDIFGLKVPEASHTVDQDLALFLRRIRRPLVPDILQIEDDLSRQRRLQSEIIEDALRQNPNALASSRPSYKDIRQRPHSVHLGPIHTSSEVSSNVKSAIAAETLYTMERSQTIEQKARVFQRKKVPWRY